MIIADLQLGFRTEHAVRLDTAQLRLLDLEITRQHGADLGEGDFKSGPHVRSATNHLERLSTIADLTNTQLVGIRMRFGRNDLTDHNPTEAAGYSLNGIDFETDHR